MITPNTNAAAAQGTPAAAPQGAAAPVANASEPGPFGVQTVSLADLGYPEAKPEAKAGANGKPVAPANAEGQAQGEGELKPESGKPGEGEGKPAAIEFVAENGRKYATLEDLGKAFNESSKEGRRLADESKLSQFATADLTAKINDANKTILAMQEYIGNSAYTPSVPEKYKGMPESEMMSTMSEDEKLDYRLDKREWAKKVDGFKKQMENAKTEATNQAIALKDHQEKTRLTMKNNPAKYPGFTELEPNMEKVLKDVPEIAGLPSARYMAYFISMGDTYLTYLRGVAGATAASKAQAAQEAAVAAAAAGGGAPNAAGGAGAGAKQPNKDDLMERTGAAYEKRNKVWAS